jgi:hypothetical protein
MGINAAKLLNVYGAAFFVVLMVSEGAAIV